MGRTSFACSRDRSGGGSCGSSGGGGASFSGSGSNGWGTKVVPAVAGSVKPVYSDGGTSVLLTTKLAVVASMTKESTVAAVPAAVKTMVPVAISNLTITVATAHEGVDSCLGGHQGLKAAAGGDGRGVCCIYIF